MVVGKSISFDIPPPPPPTHNAQCDGDEETVEGQLLAALMKTKLIKDRAWACYSRCGRTDRGVSALRQVVGLRVRSALSLPAPTASSAGDGTAAAAAKAAAKEEDEEEEEEEEETEEGTASGTGHAVGDIWSLPYPTETQGELDYCAMLNRVLPPDIRCLGWAPTPPGFSARFCASHRSYRYFFGGRHLDVEAMRRAARRLEGEHDFRNFCKMDATAVHSFRRVVHEARILRVAGWRWAVDTGASSSFALWCCGLCLVLWVVFGLLVVVAFVCLFGCLFCFWGVATAFTSNPACP
jgi:tRNA pseudouridine38/39 synthase